MQLYRTATAALTAGVLAAALAPYPVASQQRSSTAAQGNISGVVESARGREAGVWVIAETSDLATKFIKIVVTNDDGKFLLPELPSANYAVWVRGYGLADSSPVKAKPDAASLTLKAVIAATPQEAAKVFPADSWYALAEPPKASEFPGTGPSGNGISPGMTSQLQWVDHMKQGCELCHQLGNELTRKVSHMSQLGFTSSLEAWDYRVQTGQRSAEMTAYASRFGRPRGLAMFADWTDRIASGEVPPTPPRPRGAERNVVLTMWDFGTNHTYAHDEVTTSKSHPTLNAGGPAYSIADGDGDVIVVYPKENAATQIQIPTREDRSKLTFRFPSTQIKPSNFWGSKIVWSDPADPHNPMMDTKGRLWLTSVVRGRANPGWCQDAKLNPFAAYFPLAQSSRQASFYDPKTQTWALIDTCFSTHHLQFTEDKDETVYFSGGGPVIGWVNSKVYDQTHDEKRSVGWCPTVLDTNGDGKITKPWNEPAGAPPRGQEDGGNGLAAAKIDATRDTRVQLVSYGIIGNPADNSVWISSVDFPGHILRLEPGANPPATCKSELYEVPTEAGGAKGQTGFGPRGIDVERNGVIWTALSGSSALASFDRRKCKNLKGAQQPEGRQCFEGWTIYPTTGPTFKGTSIPADFQYYNWVDQFNTLGLGANLPIATGSGSDSLLVLNPSSGEWLTLRVPYPLGFYSRGLDGRIDDPGAGWKGRGVWADFGTNFIWHVEGGMGTKSKMVHFQIRPDPLAR